MIARKIYIGFVTVLIAAAGLGCDKAVSVDVGTSNGHGFVRRVDYQHHMITLDHDLIPKLLQAMTFSYKVRTDSIMNGLKPDDEVNFTITESQPGEFLVQRITKVANAPAPITGLGKPPAVPTPTVQPPHGAPLPTTKSGAPAHAPSPSIHNQQKVRGQ